MHLDYCVSNVYFKWDAGLNKFTYSLVSLLVIETKTQLRSEVCECSK